MFAFDLQSFRTLTDEGKATIPAEQALRFPDFFKAAALEMAKINLDSQFFSQVIYDLEPKRHPVTNALISGQARNLTIEEQYETWTNAYKKAYKISDEQELRKFEKFLREFKKLEYTPSEISNFKPKYLHHI